MARTDTYYQMGIRMTCPQAAEHPKGLLSPMEIGDRGDGIPFMMYSYIAADAEELAAMSARNPDGQMSPEDALKVAELMGVMLVVVGIGGGQGIDGIIEKLKMGDVSRDSFIEVGRHDDLVYYAITDRENEEKFMKEIKPAYAEEFPVIQAALIEALKNAEYIGPQIPGADMVGKTVRFETKDIDGNPVKSEDIFAKNDVTMINFWATWCGPCKSELEELGNIHRRLAGKNAAIIGVCDDADDQADACRKLIAEKNLSYVNILPYEGMDDLDVQSFPTSVFVNKDGKIMTYPIIGVPAELSDYEKTIDELLAKVKAGYEPEETNTSAVMSDDFKVIVKDEQGTPVSGVTLQLCNDTTCSIGRTNAEGTASFKADQGQYTVHVQKVPEGYEKCTEEFAIPKSAREIAITLKKA